MIEEVSESFIQTYCDAWECLSIDYGSCHSTIHFMRPLFFAISQSSSHDVQFVFKKSSYSVQTVDKYGTSHSLMPIESQSYHLINNEIVSLQMLKDCPFVCQLVDIIIQKPQDQESQAFFCHLLGANISTKIRNVCLIIQKCPGFSLKHWRQHQSSIELDELVNILSQISSALMWMDQKGILHRDLTTSNIIYCKESKKVKVIDFNQSFIRGYSEVCTEVSICEGIHAPEMNGSGELIWRNEDIYQKQQKCDLYAVGAIMFELAMGFQLTSIDQLSALQLYSSHYYQIIPIINQLLQTDPLQRMTLQQLQTCIAHLTGSPDRPNQHYTHSIKQFATYKTIGHITDVLSSERLERSNSLSFSFGLETPDQIQSHNEPHTPFKNISNDIIFSEFGTVLKGKKSCTKIECRHNEKIRVERKAEKTYWPFYENQNEGW